MSIKNAPLKDKLATFPQYIIPQHRLSQMMHWLTRREWGGITHGLIWQFIRQFNVDMNEALLPNASDYASFNAFFTRALKPEARPLADSVFISPVDGEISQSGRIDAGQLLQVKGHTFDAVHLLGGDQALAAQFHHGHFCTIYLSPRDYHRIHSPIAGQVRRMMYVPGRLFSVNQRTTRTVPHLFARNERLICVLETAIGTVIIILVGAIFVGSMETVWEGQITPPYRQQRDFLEL
jgi:phosphatidylserine decarboxylase